MSLLVRLYPAAWRERYGDELQALLEDRPPGPFDVADLLLGAIDAHLHLRGLGTISEHRKGIPMSLRLAGWAAVLSGGLWILFFAIVSVSYFGTDVGVDIDSVWAPIVLGAGLLLLAAMAGLSAVEFRHHPRWVWLAFVVPTVGICLVLVALARTLLTGDWSYDEGSMGAGILYLGLLLILVGSIAFAGVSWSSGGLGRLGAIAIALGTAILTPGMIGLVTPSAITIGGVLFGGGWALVGRDAIRRDGLTIRPQASAA